MAAQKVSLMLDEEVLAAARKLVGQRELSRYVNHALRRQVQRDGLATHLADLDAEHGAVDPRVMAEVRATWPDPEEQGTAYGHGGGHSARRRKTPL